VILERLGPTLDTWRDEQLAYFSTGGISIRGRLHTWAAWITPALDHHTLDLIRAA
jgi:hypothetical protein